MTHESVTDDELMRAGALIESSELAALSRMDEVADRLSMYATYFDRPELINEQLARYLAVDAEAVRDVCAEVFGSGSRAVLTYVPAGCRGGGRVTDLTVLEQRPGPGRPRAYDFPDFERTVLPNGLTLIRAHVPGRPLLQAQILVRGDSGGGATTEAPEQAGVTVLAARAMSEGTMRRDAVAFVEASERLGASLAASAGWDSLAVQVEVPRTRLRPAMELLAEMTLTPSFPEREVERLREERLNDLRQTMADARRRVDRLFPAVIYADGAAYGRLLAGSEETVPGLDRERLAARHARAAAA